MVIAIGIVAIVISIRTAATTDPVLPAADSAAAIQERCHHCRVRGPVSGIVVDNNAVPSDAPEASPLPPSGAMDPTAAAMTKTLGGNGKGGDGDGNGDSNGDGGGDGDGNGDGNDDGNGNGNGDGDGNGGGGVQRMRRRQPPTPPERLPPPPGGRPLDRHDDGGRRGAAAVESGNRNDVDVCDQHWRVVHWAGGSGGRQRQRRRNGG